MSFLDDERPRKQTKPQPGEMLADLSVEELKARIGLYRGEIVRLEEEIERKEKHLKAAESFFRGERRVFDPAVYAELTFRVSNHIVQRWTRVDLPTLFDASL